MNIEVIAELGQGFEGSAQQAKLLVKAAAKSGADAVKCQLVYADELSTSDYQHYDLFADLEMSEDDWRSVKEDCDEFNLELILDVFGEAGLRLAERLGLRTIKLHATDINNVGFLKLLANSSIERILVGTGGAFIEEIKTALAMLVDKNVVLLHGFQGYPTAMDDNQVARLDVLAEVFLDRKNVALGFSDHVDPLNVTSIALPIYAVGRGAHVLEKHLTLGCCMELEDYEAALNPDQFKAFVNVVRDVEAAVGTSHVTDDFGMSKNELQYRENIRRHVVSTRNLPKGTVVRETDVLLKRTSSQHALSDINILYGRSLKRDVAANSPLCDGDLE